MVSRASVYSPFKREVEVSPRLAYRVRISWFCFRMKSSSSFTLNLSDLMERRQDSWALLYLGFVSLFVCLFFTAISYCHTLSPAQCQSLWSTWKPEPGLEGISAWSLSMPDPQWTSSFWACPCSMPSVRLQLWRMSHGCWRSGRAPWSSSILHFTPNVGGNTPLSPPTAHQYQPSFLCFLGF